MDSLRLLTRGSGLKVAARTAQEPQKPSEGIKQHLPDATSSGKKRKRHEYEVKTSFSKILPQEAIRQIHKLHKIKITDLNVLHSQDERESRKFQKEASRSYPQPLQSFPALREAGVNHALLSNIVEQGYKEPTEVQLATIPMLVLTDEPEPDLLTVAPTGSGKTLAFLIPLIDKISRVHKEHDDDMSQRQVSTIILAPTKELVTQIVNEGRKLAARTGVRVTAFKKGMRLHEDISTTVHDGSSTSEADEATKARIVKADIIVSTPLSLVHSITPTDTASPLPLPHIHNLVLDEADVLLDPLFREQTLSIWSACTALTLRISFWSATIGSNIEELAITTIKSRQSSLKIHRKNRPPLLRCIIGLKDSSLSNITHKLIYASTETGKLTGLRNLIRPPPSTSNTTNAKPAAPVLRPPFLVFTQTIPRATALHAELQYDIPPSTNSDVPSRIAVLHSSLSSTQRSKIMQHFRLGKIWILITTDLLSRGIDFRGVNGVVNYDIPTTSASYVHRAGRTGRAGREGGVCVTLYTKEDVLYLRPIANIIAKSQKQHNDEVTDQEDGIPKWMIDALPALTKNAKKDLRQRGVEIRRAVKESDDKKERRRKGRNVIGTRSGYEKKLEDRRRGMIEGSQRRKARIEAGDDNSGSEDEFGGFD